MSIQLIWKRLSPLAFYAKPRNFVANFCTEITTLSTTPHRGVATEFLIDKCGLTDTDITKAFRHCNGLLRAKSSQNMEQVLELLKGCGLTTPDRIRNVVLCNPQFFFLDAETNIKPKLSFFRTFMNKDDINKLFRYDAGTFKSSERRLRSGMLLLQKLGIEGEALSELLVRHPRLLTAPEVKVIESFKLAEDLGFKKGSKMFALALRNILSLGHDDLDRKRQCMISLGFSENQISDLWRKKPWCLGFTEEKIKRNVDFVVNIVGLQLLDLVKNPDLIAYSVDKRMIPRYRVMEVLKSMQMQVPKKNGVSFPNIVRFSEKRFLEQYVNSNAESSSLLLDIYQGGKAGKLTVDRETCSEHVSVKTIHESCQG